MKVILYYLNTELPTPVNLTMVDSGEKIRKKMQQSYCSFCSCSMPDASADFMGLAEKWFLYYPIDF